MSDFEEFETFHIAHAPWSQEKLDRFRVEGNQQMHLESIEVASFAGLIAMIGVFSVAFRLGNPLVVTSRNGKGVQDVDRLPVHVFGRKLEVAYSPMTENRLSKKCLTRCKRRLKRLMPNLIAKQPWSTSISPALTKFLPGFKAATLAAFTNNRVISVQLHGATAEGS